mmetsp:Transcript_64344/g.120663  ORF Transcript_64344/g.120663 Transcript_64344/m.120663 type:complete len:405 (+) Transcript_64344:108-1322(+)
MNGRIVLRVCRPAVFGKRGVSTLILLRHGQSVWNGKDARFTGWCDVPLTVRGRVEAVAAGQLLRARGFTARKIDFAFTSRLIRAHETCELALASMAGPEQKTWSTSRIKRFEHLNERHFGVLQGETKTDSNLYDRFGEETIRSWRRTFDGAPPPLDETHSHYLPPPAPKTESLADCQKRAMECFHQHISPVLFGEDAQVPPWSSRTVMVVAHSNTIRALMAAFDKVPAESVPLLHVPNSVPILYRFHTATREPISSILQGKAGGSHARWLLSPDNHSQVQEALQPGGMLTRALYDACSSCSMADVDHHVLTVAELDAGLNSLLKASADGGNSSSGVDNAVVMVAKKVIRELQTSGNATGSTAIPLEEFERRASEVAEALPTWWADPASGRRRWTLEQGSASESW